MAKRKATKKKAASKKRFPTKTCPKCNKALHAAKAVCDKCGHRFPSRKKKKKKRGRKPQGAAAAVADSFSVAALVGAKKLAEQLGGVDQAKAALDAIARLQ